MSHGISLLEASPAVEELPPAAEVQQARGRYAKKHRNVPPHDHFFFYIFLTSLQLPMKRTITWTWKHGRAWFRLLKQAIAFSAADSVADAEASPEMPPDGQAGTEGRELCIRFDWYVSTVSMRLKPLTRHPREVIAAVQRSLKIGMSVEIWCTMTPTWLVFHIFFRKCFSFFMFFPPH